MRILVIGSNGFIGSYVADYFRVAYDLSTASTSGPTTATHHVLNRDEPALDTLLARLQPDVCINCAGAASVPQSIIEPDADFRLNVIFIQRLLEAIRKGSRHTRLINLSSAAVYGNPISLPISELDPPNPISPYGFHKLVAEQLCQSYCASYNIASISLRIFSVFGPGLRKQLYWDVFQKARRSHEIVCPGTGEETRDFIYVKDVPQAIEAALIKGELDGGVLNIASGQSVTIRDAVTCLLDVAGWRGELRFDGIVRSGDPRSWRADISKLSALGYVPRYSYRNSVEEVVEWLRHLP